MKYHIHALPDRGQGIERSVVYAALGDVFAKSECECSRGSSGSFSMTIAILDESSIIADTI